MKNPIEIAVLSPFRKAADYARSKAMAHKEDVLVKRKGNKWSVLAYSRVANAMISWDEREGAFDLEQEYWEHENLNESWEARVEALDEISQGQDEWKNSSEEGWFYYEE